MSLRWRLTIALWICATLPLAATLAGGYWLLSSVHALQPALAHERDVVVMLALGGLLLASGLAMGLAAWLVPIVSRPMSAAMEAADRIAAGTRSVQIDSQAGGEAGKLVQAFNRMARELDAAESRLRRAERIAAWRDIARQIAHEIKNPLTPIQMGIEMLRKAKARELDDFDALFEEHTLIVLEEVARLRRLVENFSKFARAPRPSFSIIDPTTIVERVVAMHQLGEAEVTGEVHGVIPELRADGEQLTQVLYNLVQNGAHAALERRAREGAQRPAAVHVSASCVLDAVVISVADNGPGVDPEVRDRLFEPYVSTKKSSGGTGLGLAVAWRIVHDHGGELSVESSREGTRFDVRLPLAGPSETALTHDGGTYG
ncbi:MAG: ATP-binding protein [Deltaproteobacteria bacterium]|nr:ATP-binding protein [Deltaproteobacteria bacterium]